MNSGRDSPGDKKFIGGKIVSSTSRKACSELIDAMNTMVDIRDHGSTSTSNSYLSLPGVVTDESDDDRNKPESVLSESERIVLSNFMITASGQR